MIEKGQKVYAMNEMRSIHNISLKEAKDIADKIEEMKALFFC